MIVVEGKEINYMIRDKWTKWEKDNWWVFLSWWEDDEYSENPSNFSIFDIKHIANNDKEIIPFLDSKFWTTFEKDNKTWKFVEIFYNTWEKTYK
jgi:hypothetical protein